MMRFAVLSLSLLLTACASPPHAERAAPSTRAQQLAALLVATEADDPARIGAAQAEMAALERALTRAPDPGGVSATPTRATSRAAEAPAPAPDLASARSLMSAVHVASYRSRDHAAPGWAVITRRHGELAGRQARLSRADLGARGVFLRLKAGPFDTPDAAHAACDAIKARGDWCSVTDFTGEAL